MLRFDDDFSYPQNRDISSKLMIFYQFSQQNQDSSNNDSFDEVCG
jgi:hypothetical protein